MQHTVPGAILRMALWADVRMTPSLADEGRQAQRFQVHPRSLGQRAEVRFSQGRARACPPPRCPSSVTQGLLLDLEEIPVGRAQCQGWKLSLFHADLAKSSQPTSTVSGLLAPAQARRDATQSHCPWPPVKASSASSFPWGRRGKEEGRSSRIPDLRPLRA